ncbi:hypothetical protein Tco_0751661 [Tanacetum coccineum]|uniref:Uncharacterized protein n=1 Tax=Tanacetum coccineum TaxID=301880 RepID=A0ABQ4Z7T4_9ASTR
MSIPVRAVKEEDTTEDSAKNLYITVKVASQMNELDPYFRVRRNELLKQLMIRWCARADFGDYKTVRFLDPEGTRINVNKTADEFGMLLHRGEDICEPCKIARKLKPFLADWTHRTLSINLISTDHNKQGFKPIMRKLIPQTWMKAQCCCRFHGQLVIPSATNIQQLSPSDSANKRNAKLVARNICTIILFQEKEKSCILQSEKEKIFSEKKDLADSYLDEIVCLKNANKVARDMLQRFNMPTQTIPMLSKKPKAATADLHKALLGTRNPGLGYMAKRAQPALYDADYAGWHDTKTENTFWFSSFLSWTTLVTVIPKSKKVLAISTTEAEYIAYQELCSILWMASSTARLWDLRSTKFRLY